MVDISPVCRKIQRLDTDLCSIVHVDILYRAA